MEVCPWAVFPNFSFLTLQQFWSNLSFLGSSLVVQYSWYHQSACLCLFPKPLSGHQWYLMDGKLGMSSLPSNSWAAWHKASVMGEVSLNSLLVDDSALEAVGCAIEFWPISSPLLTVSFVQMNLIRTCFRGKPSVVTHTSYDTKSSTSDLLRLRGATAPPLYRFSWM